MTGAEQTAESIESAAAGFDDLSVVVDMRLAGVPVRARVAGDLLAATLVPSLLSTEPAGTPEIELRAVDAAGVGAPLPSLPWRSSDYLQREEIRGWTEPPRLAAFDTAHGAASVSDTDLGRGTQWFRDARSAAPWEGGSPLRSLLRWHLARRGVHLLHGAVVDTGSGGVLLAGPGGSGKSTTALAALGQGMGFIGDDYVLVNTGDRPVAFPVYGIAKADERSLALLPTIADRAVGAPVDWRGKRRLPVSDLISEQSELRAIVLPTVGARTGRPRPVAPSDALATLVPAMLFQLPGDAATTLSAIGSLLERLPVFAIEVGPDIERVPERLAALVHALESGS